MKKVYQTIVDKGNGNCMQAAVASLFGRSLEQVPNFIELGQEWYSEMSKFFGYNGYEMDSFYKTEATEDFYLEALEFDGGVDGLFYGVVPSLTFGEGVTHAVIVDKELNIVHDPNPNQLAMTLGPKDVIYVYTNRPGWHIEYGDNGKGSFIINQKEKWRQEKRQQ